MGIVCITVTCTNRAFNLGLLYVIKQVFHCICSQCPEILARMMIVKLIQENTM